MIVIYTKENCEKCTDTKKRLKEKGYEYTEKSLSDPANITDLLMAGIVIEEAPVVYRDGKYYTNKTGLLRAIA